MLHVDKKRKFDILIQNVTQCDLCKRMEGRSKILSYRNGNLNSEVVFIGEAPGRLGADRTRIPFYGDQAGRNFERLVAVAGLSREEIFITNAVLCNPRDEKGNNTTPTREEVFNCSLHLSLVLDIVEPEVIVPMGQCALNALSAIAPHLVELNRDVHKPVKWGSYILLPVYHPGPRAIIHRNITNQSKDFFVLREILEGTRTDQRESYKRQLPLLQTIELSLVQKVIFRIVQQIGPVSKFKLAKLLYLLDWQEVKATGNVLTGCYYIFQKNGPLATGLSQAISEMEDHELLLHFEDREPIYVLGHDVRFDMRLSSDVANKLDSVIAHYGQLTDAQIKTRAYLTEPMKNILRRQKTGDRMINHPIFEGWIPPTIK